MATSLTEGQHAGEFVIDERPSLGSRKVVTILSGQTLKAGSVIGRVRFGIGRAAATAVSGTGNGTLSGLVVGPDVEVGTYTIKCVTAAANGGVFSITTPSGKRLANATVGTAYESRHLSLLLNDGSTDFAVNDQFTVVVSTTAPTVVGTGNGTIGTLALKRGAKPGRYRFLCTVAGTNASTFECYDPDGAMIERAALSGSGAAATFSTNPQVGAVITDGGTDFAVGDVFDVVVHNALAGGKVVAWDPTPTAFDGRQVACGVLYDAVDASAADKTGVAIYRDAIVKADDLVFDLAAYSGEQANAFADLEAVGITVRE